LCSPCSITTDGDGGAKVEIWTIICGVQIVSVYISFQNKSIKNNGKQ